jgi:hypothetical protein
MYLQPFQMWTGNSLLTDPVVELKNVITDRTFRQAESARSDSGYFKARAMAWALSYYLAQKYPNELRDYFKELAALPRELELDEATLLRAFARSFKLMDSKNPNEISDAALATFAKNWITAMKSVKLEAEDMVNLVRKYESDANLHPKGSGSGSK